MIPGRKSLFIGLLFIALVLVNYLASSLPLRIDATSDKIYTLSPGTRAMLSKIDEPMVLDYYFTRSVAGMPIRHKNFADRVGQMIREYARASHGRITVNVIDPKPDTPEEERASLAGLSTEALSNGDKFEFGLVATQADQQKVIEAFNPDREQFLEYDLSQLIYSVQQFDRKKLGLITSLPLLGQPATQATNAVPKHYVIDEWESSFEVVSVAAAASELPGNLDVLAIVHPEGMSPQMEYAIDQFALSGKPIFVAVDPTSYYFRMSNQGLSPVQGQIPNVSSELPKLFAAAGIDYNADKVVGDSENALKNNGVSNFVQLSLKKPNFNGSALPTAQLNQLWFVEAGYVAPKAGAATTFTPLVETSDKAGEVDGLAVQFAQAEDLNRLVKPMAKKTIAALVTGKFHTAFPDGPPSEEPLPPGAPPRPAPATPKAEPLKESKTQSTLVVVADSDWLMNFVTVASGNPLLGQPSVLPRQDNLNFAANILEYLGGSQDLISIRGKGSSIRPFTVVDAMLADASRKYGEKMNELNKRRSDVQSKLSELQSRTSESNMLVAPPDVTRALDDFRKEQVKVNEETRQIKRAYREDIDALESRLLAVNMLASPLLVCAFGILFYRKRRKS